jgi:uncharacterized protein (DUF1697 family)
VAVTTCIALLRGINVGGSHMVAMRDLKAMFETLGCTGVQTYIQSGNVIFRSAAANRPALAKRLSAAVSERHGFEPRVLVLTSRELERAAAANPFREADGDPRSLHLFFLADRPRRPDLTSLEALKAPTERFALTGRTFYLHTPAGFAGSRLAARVERVLGVAATARNWRTVITLLQMARSCR